MMERFGSSQSGHARSRVPCCSGERSLVPAFRRVRVAFRLGEEASIGNPVKSRARNPELYPQL